MKAKEDKENQDPQQAPPVKKQKVSSDNDDDVVIELKQEQRDGNLKEQLIRMEKRMEKMKRHQEQMDKKLDSLVTYLKGGNGACAAAVKKEEEDDKFLVIGVNLLRIHSTRLYTYALTLLDTLFTREEQHPCLLFKSSKSDKPGLDPVRVEILLSCLDKKYGNKEWNMKTLKEKVNQKCRDALKKEKSS